MGHLFVYGAATTYDALAAEHGIEYAWGAFARKHGDRPYDGSMIAFLGEPTEILGELPQSQR